MKIIPLIRNHYPDVARIYEDGQATGIATFETSVPNWSTFNSKFLQDGRYVALINDNVVAWCALTAVSKRQVYSGVAETTLYVNENARGKGYGTLLLKHLISESEKMGFWTLQAQIFKENMASIRLYQKCRFRIVGVREKIGQRNGIWHDNVLLERRSEKIHF